MKENMRREVKKLMEEEPQQPLELGTYDHTIIGELEVIVNKVRELHLCPEYWTLTAPVFEDLTQKLGLTKMQVLLIGVLIDDDTPLSWSDLGNKMGISRIRMLTYASEMKDLIIKQWVRRIRKRNRDNALMDTFVVGYQVMTQLQNDRPFIPEPIDNLSPKEVQKRMCILVSEGLEDTWFDDDKMTQVMELLNANSSLEICKRILDVKDSGSRRLLIFSIWAYLKRMDRCFHLSCSYSYFADREWDATLEMAQNGEGEIFRKKFVENDGDDGMAEAESIRLTKYGIKKLVVGMGTRMKKRGDVQRTPYSDIIQHKTIHAHELFFGPEEQQGVDRLKNLMDDKSFREVQKRLKQEGMRKGVACLFYGAPGTGKTELAKQLARLTMRDIMQVDISNIKDKWVGESEKAIKEVFIDYRELCQKRTRIPILLFNECDAVLNKRTENAQSAVDKMENAMQNIILQELEDLEGIVICTTNLTSNLDKAFERRFLFKLEFHKPNAENKARIIQNMMPHVSKEDAWYMAREFELSGGQIENIARKNSIDYILSGQRPDLEQLKTYCREEIMGSSKTKRPIGFNS